MNIVEVGQIKEIFEDPIRVAKIELDARGLLTIFKDLQKGRLVGVSGLPADAKAIGFTQDTRYPNRVFLFVKSKTFLAIQPGQEVPYLYPPLTLSVKHDSDKN